ncbi:MAG: rhomboid family intramembrane serine protease [Planctomycetes bacterium]|nr:rhomboid family intramembrane serine protease [Planctomycetota bacterium]
MFLPIGDVNPTERTPYVNYAFIGINVAAFLMFGVAGGAHYAGFVREYGLVPARLQAPDFLTAMFLHADFLHLIGNMLFLWICGDNVEDRYGHLGYIGIYLGSGLAASIAHIAMSPGSDIPCIGASGAIAGVLGAYVVMFPHARIKFWYWFGLLWSGVTYIRAMWAIGFWFVEQFFMGSLASFEAGGMTGVAYWAHVGGFVLGAAATFGLAQLGGLGGKPALKKGGREEEDWYERAYHYDDRRFRW